MQPPDFQPVQFGRYRLVEKLAVGGMAEIFKAKAFGAHGFEKTLVVKRILPSLAEDADFIQMFITEARVMVQLTHPKVVQVLDFGEVDGQYYIAMEYVQGIDGLALLRTCARHRCRPTTGIAIAIIADVLDALDYAHNLKDQSGVPLGVVHLDISPSNIFISDLGEVKLGDFGIARVGSRRKLSEASGLKGKYGYMSPEVVTGGTVDHRSDLFSVGVVLAELLMIRRLYIAKTELEVLLQVRDARLDRLDKYGHHLVPELRSILESALARDPETRYQDAAAFRDALHRFLFDQKRMVRNTDVRNFLGRLRELDAGGETPTLKRTATSLPAITPTNPERVYAPSITPTVPRPADVQHPSPRGAVPLTEYSARTRERLEIVGRPGAAGPEISFDIDEDVTPSGLSAAPTAQDQSPSRPAAGAPRGAAGNWEPETLSVGKKRRIQLGPPPRPEPIPSALPDTGEEPRISTDDMLLAVNELESSGGSSSAHDFRSGDSIAPENMPSLVAIAAEAAQAKPPPISLSSGTSSPLPAPEAEADLSKVSLARIVFRLAVVEETGLLVLRSAGLVKEVYLVDGDPQYVQSNLAEELFGQYLVKKGVISEGELSMALAMLPHCQGKLGNALVMLKLLRPVQVLRHLTHQVRQKLLNAFAWEEGSAAFYRGRTCEQQTAPLGLEAFEVIGAAITALPQQFLSVRLQPSLAGKPRSVSKPPVPPEVFRLGPRPRQIFDRLDGRLTLGELLHRFDDLGQRDAYARVIYLFLECGLAVLA